MTGSILDKLRHLRRMAIRKEYRILYHLKQLPRYQAFQTNLLGFPIQGTDGRSCAYTYEEIFQKKIYAFKASTNSPLIIDCGANIGLSILFFKSLYPKAKIIAFEPDPLIFKALEANIKSSGYTDITLHQKAVWTQKTALEFVSEGADGGRINTSNDASKKIKVEAVPLRQFLDIDKIDLLKIDIEGAETEVLIDCKDALQTTERVFVEYHSFEGKKQTLHELLAVLSENNYRIHASPVGFSAQPFIKRESYLGIDLQFNIYAFRD